jgi:hypothetical protein
MMNKQREKIIAYLDESLNADEKLQFEESLRNDTQLQNEVARVKTFLSSVKADAEPSLNDSYFINMLPEFHQNPSKKKKFLFSKMAYSLSTVAVVLLVLFFIFKPGKTTVYNDLQQLSANLSEQDMNEILNQYENPYSMNGLISSASSKTDSLVNNVVDNELDLSSGSVDKMIADKYINTDELLNSLNEKEADELYSQLINKDFLNGER